MMIRENIEPNVTKNIGEMSVGESIIPITVMMMTIDIVKNTERNRVNPIRRFTGGSQGL